MSKSVIARPVVFVAVLAAVAVAFAAAGWTLMSRGGASARGPLVIAVDRASLPDALADAPFIAANDRAEVWIVSTPDCPACAELERGLAARLAKRGVGVRVMIAAPRDEDYVPANLARVAGLAARLDWATYVACFRDGEQACAAEALEPAAADGYLEWGRAALDRIAVIVRANDAEVAYPLVFWRAGKEWRGAVGGDAEALAALERDFGS